MKKLFILCVAIFVFALVLTGCDNTPVKTEFSLNEPAKLDDIEITMIDATYQNNILEVEFKIKNNRDNTISIAPDTYFRLYDINQVQVPNKYQNDNNMIKKGDTINFTLQYSIQEKEIYEILFYSGIVENNIKFTITNLNN